MGEKVAKIGIKRDKDIMYYVKGGDVWGTPRKRPGQPKGRATKIHSTGVTQEEGYLYYLDGDGDVARAARQVGGSKRKKGGAKKAAPKKAKKPAAKMAAKKPAAKKAAKKPAKKGGGKKGKRR
jgi:hypothetical protein